MRCISREPPQAPPDVVPMAQSEQARSTLDPAVPLDARARLDRGYETEPDGPGGRRAGDGRDVAHYYARLPGDRGAPDHRPAMAVIAQVAPPIPRLGPEVEDPQVAGCVAGDSGERGGRGRSEAGR